MADSTFTIVSGSSQGTLSGTTPGLACTINGNFTGLDSFTFKMNSNGDPTYCTTAFYSTPLDFYNAIVTFTINVFNDAPAITVDATEQTVQYRDEIIPVTIDASDIDSPEISISLKVAPE